METIIYSLRLRGKGAGEQKGPLSNGERYVSQFIFQAMCCLVFKKTLLAH